MNDMGVVDPLRLPAPVVRLTREAPRLARVFIAATLLTAVLDVVATPGLQFPADVIGVLAMLSRDLVVALPAAALMHRPAVQFEAPWVFWGLVLCAVGRILVVALGVPRVGVTPDDAGLSFASAWASLLPLLGRSVMAGGWAAVAWGFLGRGEAKGSARAVSAAWILGSIVVGSGVANVAATVQLLAIGDITLGEVSLAALVVNLALTLISGVLVWVFIGRASADRSPSAIAAALWAILTAAGAGVTIATSGWFGLAPAVALTPLYNWIVIAVNALPPVLLLVAFGAGLADGGDITTSRRDQLDAAATTL